MRTRREFLKQGAAIAATATLPVASGAALNPSAPKHTTIAYRGTIDVEVLLDSSGAFNGVHIAGTTWEWEPARAQAMNALMERSQNTESCAATPSVDEAHALIDKAVRATPRENQETDTQGERSCEQSQSAGYAQSLGLRAAFPNEGTARHRPRARSPEPREREGDREVHEPPMETGSKTEQSVRRIETGEPIGEKKQRTRESAANGSLELSANVGDKRRRTCR